MARRPARLSVAFLLVLAVTLLAAAAPALGAGWGKPFQFQKPGTLDALAPQLAFAPGGASAAAFGTLQVDVPARHRRNTRPAPPAAVSARSATCPALAGSWR